MSNQITILRKVVNNNIPMFADEDDTPQNLWFRVMDLRCVDADPGITARVWELENAPNYQNQDTVTYYNFSFDSAHQQVRPPYDIKEGDYVGFRQGDELHFWRIVRREPVQLFHNCCTYILTCNVTNPREIETMMGCGVLKTLTDTEIENIGNPDPTTESNSEPTPTPDPDDDFFGGDDNNNGDNNNVNND